MRVYTDHCALESIKNGPSRLNNRLTKYQLILNDYDFLIHYNPGRKQKIAHCLSRNAIGDYLPNDYED